MLFRDERDPRSGGAPPATGRAAAALLLVALVGTACDQQDAWLCCMSTDGSSCRCDVRGYDDTACAADQTSIETCNTDVVADGVSTPYCCLDEESCLCHGASAEACTDGTLGNVPGCPGSMAPELCSAVPTECEESADCNCGQECLTESDDEEAPMACAYPCEDDAECALISEALTVPLPSCVERGTLQACE
ncbi:MAG: hypothetical protein WKG00_19070 [Polyangiaceae bacterium]